jgi:PAS domain S-box-containing protein
MNQKSSSFHQNSTDQRKARLQQKIKRLKHELASAEQEWQELQKDAAGRARLNLSEISLHPLEDTNTQPEWAFLQAVIEHHQSFMLVIDKNFRCLAISKKARDESHLVLGHTIHPGTHLADILEQRKAQLPGIRQLWESVLRGEERRREISVKNNEGGVKRYRLHFFPFKDQNGNILGGVQAGYDMTDLVIAYDQHQQPDKALQFSDNKLRGIIHSAGDAIAAIDRGHRIIEVNKPAEKLLRPLIGSQSLSSRSIDTAGVSAAFLKKLNKALDGQVFTSLEKIRFAPKQKTHAYEVTFSPIRDKDGTLIGTTLIGRDISHEQRIEQELKDIREFRFLAENMAQLIWTTRPNGEPEYYNSRFHQYTGITLDILRIRQWRSIIHPKDLRKALKVWQQALRLGTPCEMEYRILRHSDRAYRWHLVRSIPMKDHEGNISRWIGTATDIHDIKEQKEEIEDKNLQLQRINRYLDDFVHATAHDMRVPVTRLQLLIDTFKDLSGEERERLLPKIVRSVNHLDSALRGLIQVIDLEGQHESVETQIALRPALEEILQRYEDELRNRQVGIRIHEEESCKISYIRAYLNTILSNMISNALKHSHPGRQLQLDITISRKEDYCTLVFEDNGIGINLEKYGDKLFQPFRRFNRDKEGLGLGLYVIQTMVWKNGGHIEVESKPGKGSVFRIMLKEYE